MNPFRHRNLPVEARRLLCVAVALAGPLLALAAPSVMPSTARFSFNVAQRDFDGSQLNVVMLVAPTITLTTDTLGGWIPLEEPQASAGISFRHENVKGAKLNVSLLASDWAASFPARWNSYVDSVLSQLGDGTTKAGELDSSTGPALAVVGWRTREIIFTHAAPDGSGGWVEHHVLASDGKQAILFVLSGDAASFQAATASFHLFLARLDRVTK